MNPKLRLRQAKKGSFFVVEVDDKNNVLRRSKLYLRKMNAFRAMLQYIPERPLRTSHFIDETKQY